MPRVFHRTQHNSRDLVATGLGLNHVPRDAAPCVVRGQNVPAALVLLLQWVSARFHLSGRRGPRDRLRVARHGQPRVEGAATNGDDVGRDKQQRRGHTGSATRSQGADRPSWKSLAGRHSVATRRTAHLLAHQRVGRTNGGPASLTASIVAARVRTCENPWARNDAITLRHESNR